MQDALREIKAFDYSGLVEKVSCGEKTETSGSGARIAMVDYGAKRSMVSAFLKRKCTTAVFPSCVSAKELLEWKPDGIVLANGPATLRNAKR
jgi:carbamoyl-phosphate synthase small subunit